MEIVAMPQLGETVTEGTITTWLVTAGQEVTADQALFEVSTEKVDTEVPSAVAGHVRAILVAEGATVPVGTPVAVITATADEPVDLGALDASLATPEVAAPEPGATGEPLVWSGSRPVDRPTEPAPGTGPEPAPEPAPGPAPAPAPTPVARASVGATGAVAVLSPAVRRLLAEHGLEPSEIAGSGRDGRITRQDVLAAAALRSRSVAAAADRPGPPGPLVMESTLSAPAPASAPPTPAPPSVPAGPTDARPTPPAGPSRPLAWAATPTPGTAAPGPDATASTSTPGSGDDPEVVELSRARLTTAAHLVRSLATAAHALVVMEVDYSAVEPVRRSAGLSYLPFVARAVVDAVREFPHVNASFDGTRLLVHRHVHLGVAVDVDHEALMVPVVREAEGLRLPALAAAITDRADRARRHRLQGDELEGGTLTLTNIGAYGTVSTLPIINQPEVAILSTDGVRMAPVAVRTDPGAGDPDADPRIEPSWGIAVHPVGNLSLSFDHRAFDGAYAAAFLARVREILQTRVWAEELGG